MRTLGLALLCGLGGVLTAILATIGSNQFVHGYNFQSGYEAATEPVVFGGMGLLWGITAGLACAFVPRQSGFGRRVMAGLGVMVAGIAIVSGGVTVQRSMALPQTPTIDGKDLWLEFELRLPSGYAGTGNLPRRGELRTHGQGTDIVNATLDTGQIVMRDGRATIPGEAELRRSARDRQLDVFDGNVPWPSFMLALPGSPTKADMEWSNWYPVDGSKDSDAVRRARGYQIRYRVILESN